MFPQFTLDPTPTEARQRTAAELAIIAEMESRMIPEVERKRLELLLLVRLKEQREALNEMLAGLGSHWTYEDGFYRFYHASFKVYGIQGSTISAVELLRKLMPERKLNLLFEEIIRAGTGKQFELAHNENWEAHTRPMLEAFSHAKFMIEMAVRYADLVDPPQPMPSGYAALLYLFDLR